MIIQIKSVVSNNFKNAIHLADIHIPNSIERHEEYKTVFNNVEIKLKSLNLKNLVIVICGDIFHDARKDGMISPNAIVLFKLLINKLSKYGKVVLIQGNHDNNITFQSSHVNVKKDAIYSILINLDSFNKHVFYMRDTGIYQFGNILFYHTSVFDIDKYSEQRIIINANNF